MKEALIFIYNANSGKVNALLDVYHKIASPHTYQCNLCKLTHGVFKEKAAWTRFKNKAGIKMLFLHSDEFKQQYKSKFGHKYEFPIVLLESVSGLEIFISHDELNQLKELNELITLVQKRLSF